MEILLAGQVQIPKIICQKTIRPSVLDIAQERSSFEVIPLAVKNAQGLQKFRIPFKNAAEHEVEMEFYFEKASMAVSAPAIARQAKQVQLSLPEGQVASQSPVDFTITPNVVKIPAGAQAIMLNIQAKLKNSYLLENEDLPRSNTADGSVTSNANRDSLVGSSRALLRKSLSGEEPDAEARLRRMAASNIEKYSHLLVAKVHETNMMFSFFVEASIIDVESALGAAAGQQ